MPKRIVFCADGTWNGPEQQTGVTPIDSADDHGELNGAKVTNVVKLFANLAGRVTPDTMTMRDEQEKVLVDAAGGVVQIAKYIHGNKFSTVAGELAFGKDGEWAEPRTVFTQFQDVQANDAAQFSDGKKQPILWPEKYKTGTMIYPYSQPKP